MYRLVALDVDGTVLDSDHRLRPRVARAIQAAQAAGAHICLATGKLFGSLGDLVKELGLTGPQITCNGTVIRDADTGAILRQWPLTPDELHLSRLALAHCAPDIALGWYTADAIYTDGPHSSLDDYLALYHEPPVIHVPRLDGAIPEPVKLLIALEPHAIEPIRACLEAQLAGQIHVLHTAAEYLETTSLHHNKGTALEYLMRDLGIPRDEVMAIGDGENDIPMLRAAGLGIAMGNAAPAIQSHARAITATNEADGVAVALERYILDSVAADD